MHNETTKDGYVGGVKRRPREEWVIQRDTHQALITDAQAEAILSRLSAGRITNYRTKGTHLLTGMLVTPEGESWHGNVDRYRAGSRNVNAELIDSQVLARIAGDLQSPAFIKSLTESARHAGKLTDDDAEGEEIRKEIKKLDAKINKLSDLLSETSATEALIQKIEEFADRRDLLKDQLSTLEVVRRQSKAMREIKESDVKNMLAAMADNLPDLDRNALKDLLRGLVEHITLNSQTLDCCIHYKIKLDLGELVASPGGTALNPTFTGSMPFCVQRYRRAA